MQLPAVDDTIVAVSSAWTPSPVGIIRLSGPECVRLAGTVGLVPDETASAAQRTVGRVRVYDAHTLPAVVLWFRAPHSYTGQDVVEIHCPGNPAALRTVCAALLTQGARRALPGEFTARAYLLGRMDARRVAGVLALLRAQDDADRRAAVRLARDSVEQLRTQVHTRLTDLLARIEAGIDFVEEDDIRFVERSAAAALVDEVLAQLRVACRAAASTTAAGRSHVALAGLPNAGKSTLFNALLGSDRAIVSPVPGTTRDVITAELTHAGQSFVLQDCAGLGGTATELELAMRLATEQATRAADLVLWVQAADAEWPAARPTPLADLGPSQCLLVQSKCDVAAPAEPPAAWRECPHVPISVATGAGLDALRDTLIAHLAASPGHTSAHGAARDILSPAIEPLERAAGLLAEDTATPDLQQPELVALELRLAIEALAVETPQPLDEQLLERIYGEFCVGK